MEPRTTGIKYANAAFVVIARNGFALTASADAVLAWMLIVEIGAKVFARDRLLHVLHKGSPALSS
jgi:hypothetical protein